MSVIYFKLHRSNLEADQNVYNVCLAKCLQESILNITFNLIMKVLLSDRYFATLPDPSQKQAT